MLICPSVFWRERPCRCDVVQRHLLATAWPSLLLKACASAFQTFCRPQRRWSDWSLCCIIPFTTTLSASRVCHHLSSLPLRKDPTDWMSNIFSGWWVRPLGLGLNTRAKIQQSGEKERENFLPSSTVTFPLKKNFPWPLERATPRLKKKKKNKSKMETLSSPDQRKLSTALF